MWPWCALDKHGNDAKLYKNTLVSMMHQGVLAELMWQAEMQEESMAVLQRSPSACEYVIALELPVGEVFEDFVRTPSLSRFNWRQHLVELELTFWTTWSKHQ
jgi:hypothetical protein